MTRFLTTLFALLIATTVSAQTLPERYSVDGVAADDTLNIRSEPDASADIIGEFGPYDINVEILRQQDGWGYTGAGERSGWVSMRYLTPNPIPEYEVPRPLICSGTEPFWTMAMYPRGAEYHALGMGSRRLNILREAAARNGFVIDAEEGPTLQRTLVVNGLPCNDGMSDRDFGMSATLFTEAPDGNYVQTGCCTMQVN